MKKVVVAREFPIYPSDWHFSPALDTGGFVFFSGVTGVRPDQSIALDPPSQFRDVFRFVRMHLRAAGLDFEQIVDLTTYHIDLRRHLADFITIKDEFIQGPYPKWTAVGVTELITPGALVEARIIAQRD